MSLRLRNMPGKKVNNKRKNVRGNRNFSKSGYAPVTQITSKRTVVFPYPVQPLLGEASPGVGFVWSFRVNSLFDPDFTGAGAQPLGFDQFAALYGRYAVIHSKYEVTFANTTSLPVRIGFFLSPQSTVPSAAATWSSQPFGKSTSLGAIGSGRDVVILRGSTNLFSELGVTKRQYQDEADFSATTSANPLRVLYLHVFTHAMTAAGNATVAAFVKLSQTAELSQLVSQTYS